MSTKIHALGLDERHVLGLALSAGQAGDAPVGEEMIAQVVLLEEISALSADRAYDSDAIRARLAQAGIAAVIPPTANRLQPPAYDKERYKERNKIERLFNRLKHFRAVATRYDKLKEMFLASVIAALLVICLK